MRTTYCIAASHEGTLSELLSTTPAAANAPTLDEMLDVMGSLAFIVETVAHLQGKERELLPTADKARKMVDFFRPTVDIAAAAPTLGERLMPGCTCGAAASGNFDRCRCD